MYEIILILSLIVTGSVCYDTEFDGSLSSEIQSEDRYLESSNARRNEDNRPPTERRRPIKLPSISENIKSYQEGRQEPSKTVIVLQPSNNMKGVLRARTDNYEHRLRTNAPPLARVPLHREQAGFKQTGNANPPVVKEDMSDTRNVKGETYQQQGTQNQERKNDPYQQTRSRQSNDNRRTFSGDHTFSIEKTTPAYKDTYEDILDDSSSIEGKRFIDNYYNQGKPTQTKPEHSNTFRNNAEPPREKQKSDLPQREDVTQTNDGRQQKIPRRNFTLSYTDGNRNTPLRKPTQPDRTSDIYTNNSPVQTVQTVRNKVKNKQDNPRERTNQPNKNQGQSDDDQFKNDNSYETGDGNSFSKTKERDQSFSSDYLSTLEKNTSTKSKLEPELDQKTGGKDDKWIWSGGEQVKQKITTPAANVVTVDDRANFMGDKCATGMIRLGGKCVYTD